MAKHPVLDVTISTPAEIAEVPCAGVGCRGCDGIHRRLTGRRWVEIEVPSVGYRYRAEVIPGTDGWEALSD